MTATTAWPRASTTGRMIRRTSGGNGRGKGGIDLTFDGGIPMTRWTLRAVPLVASLAVCFAGLLAAVAAPAIAQQPTGAGGTLTGTVGAVESKAPLQGAQVTITGTTLRATANAEGRYVIRNVPAGSHTVRAQLLGFSPKEQTV